MKILSTVLIFYFFSCAEGKNKNLIQESKFKDILYDLHLTEARLEYFEPITDSFFYAAGKGYEKVFSKHGVTQVQFQQTFSFYQQNPKEFEKLYESVVEKLSEEDAKMRGE